VTVPPDRDAGEELPAREPGVDDRRGAPVRAWRADAPAAADVAPHVSAIAPIGAVAATGADDAASGASRMQRLAADRAGRLAGRRRRHARRMTTLAAMAAVLTVAPLVSILAFLLARGLGGLATILTARAADAGGVSGGFWNAVVGSLVLLAVACGTGLPVGLGAGLWLAARRGRRSAAVVRYLADVLIGVPSIVVGIVAWQLLVRPVGHFSAWAGGVALAAMIVPLVARTTDDMLAQMPAALSEAALALGYPRWRAALDVVLRAALPGVVTGALLAVARVAGEAAPLLFTAFGNQFWSVHPGRPIAALPLRIYTSALSAAPEMRAQAYAGALVLVGTIALVGLGARRATRARATPPSRLGAGPLGAGARDASAATGGGPPS
jgi:phosphate transport system permease protein